MVISVKREASLGKVTHSLVGVWKCRNHQDGTCLREIPETPGTGDRLPGWLHLAGGHGDHPEAQCRGWKQTAALEPLAYLRTPLHDPGQVPPTLLWGPPAGWPGPGPSNRALQGACGRFWSQHQDALAPFSPSLMWNKTRAGRGACLAPGAPLTQQGMARVQWVVWNFCAWMAAPRADQGFWPGLWFLSLFWAAFPESERWRLPRVPPGLVGVILLFLMAASVWRRIIKVPDHPEALCFQIRGAAPPYVYAVGRGERGFTDRGRLWETGLCVWWEFGGGQTVSTSLCLLVHHWRLLSLLVFKAGKCRWLWGSGSYK